MVSSLPPEQSVRDLPIKTVCLIALKTITGNLPALVQMALFPFFLSALITALSIQTLDSPSLSLLFGILSYVPHTLFAVAWHRRTLLDLQQTETTSITAWGQNHWGFLFHIILLLAIYFGITLIGSIPISIVQSAMPPLGPFLNLAIFIATLYVIARVSFVLPANAVGEKYSLKDSWKHTEKQGWRLLGAFFLLTIPFFTVIFFIIALVGNSLLPEFALTPGSEENIELVAEQLAAYFNENLGAFSIIYAVFLALTYLPTAAVISMLSIAFKGCTGWVPAEDISDEDADEDTHEDTQKHTGTNAESSEKED
ncbi:hypothetical protein [Kiloniella sp.]|uniref:hypothetical protein n=1 Tax=Kiloniella sp. TaxID=1938587 RepID=UPI003B021342